MSLRSDPGQNRCGGMTPNFEIFFLKIFIIYIFCLKKLGFAWPSFMFWSKILVPSLNCVRLLHIRTEGKLQRRELYEWAFLSSVSGATYGGGWQHIDAHVPLLPLPSITNNGPTRPHLLANSSGPHCLSPGDHVKTSINCSCHRYVHTIFHSFNLCLLHMVTIPS